jgi:hypothetical protein
MCEGKVIVDHIFGDPPPAPSPMPDQGKQPQGAVVRAVKVSEPAAQSITSEDTGSTIGAAKKSIGPLTITNVSYSILFYSPLLAIYVRS